MGLTTDDTIEILQLYSRYNTAIDTGDRSAFGDCFVPDGIFDNGMNVIEGQSAIAKFAEQTHSAMPGLRHNAVNIVVEGDGESAAGSAFLIGYLVDGGYKVIVTGRYSDELTRASEGWRFTKRVFKADG
jgi:ketosteroid isomerase-like protein